MAAPPLKIFLGLDELETPERLRRRAAELLGLPEGELGPVRVVRRSLDARKGRPLGFWIELEVGAGLETGTGSGSGSGTGSGSGSGSGGRGGRRVLVVGSGPAGTFAALRSCEAGFAVTVLEQGRPVQPRRHDLAALVQRGALSERSNYCFGEGGAGTFSDGKLYTRVKDRAAVARVLRVLIEHGADPEIAVDSRPHIGSNLLPRLLVRLRADLEGRGVAYRFGAALDDLLLDARGRVVGARLDGGEELACDALILACGHSARPLYERLVERRVACEAKPFAVGVRVEHPQPLIDELQYGEAHRHPRLPAAFYEVKARARGRGVYSFCMCPGGWVVNSATEAEALCTNGMSLSRRDSPLANAALVVEVGPADFAPYARAAGDPLAGLRLQRALERAAFSAGGGGFVAAAQLLTEFVAGRASATTRRSTYLPGVVAGDVAAALPAEVAAALREGVRAFDRILRGFLTAEAQLVGVETRTSAPVRILRGPTTFASPSHPGLYPCGEGAGFAGGIVSAAIDGLRVADAVTLALG